MSKVPLFLQHDISDCGAACLKMITGYYGANISLSQCRNLTLVTKEGVSLLGLSEAAETLGFRTLAVKTNFDKLQQAPLPCVVFWNQQHFIVVERIRKKRSGKHLIRVCDPAVGKVTYSAPEFCSGWYSSTEDGAKKGLALILETTPEFPRNIDIEEKPKTFSYTLKYLKPYSRFVLQLFVGLLYGCLIQLLFPILTQFIVDKGIGTNNIPFIYIILIAQLILVVSSFAVDFVERWILLHLGTKINISLVTDFLIKLTKLPLSFFDTRTLGDLLRRIDDQERIRSFITGSSIRILLATFNLTLFGSIIFIYNKTIFLVFFTGSLLYYLWIRIFLKKRKEIDQKNFAQEIRNQNKTVEILSSMQEIRLCGCEKQKRWEWEEVQAKLFRLRSSGLALSQYQESGAIFINQIKNIIISAMAAKMVVDGILSLGMMMSLQYIIGQLNSPIDQLIGFLREYQDAKISFERQSEIQNQPEEEPINISFQKDIPVEANITLKDISFSYNLTTVGKPVIDCMSLVIPTGKQTAIVGMSGSGKTTIIKLLLGFYSPQLGQILLGQNSLSNYSMREWRKHCGIVMQDGFIFSDTIAHNIAPGADEIDLARLREAIELANLNDFVETLPLRYNTKIGEEGHGLSQGQKQRILIARAIYKNPHYVFLDEATNSLDANNEKKIMDNLHFFLKGRTSVIVAHRLSTVRNADQIVVLNNGKIVEIGTHSELLSEQGFYYNLIKNQLNV